MALQAEGRVQDWEICLQPREASPFHAAITVAAKRNSEGRLVGLRWLIRDITERKRADEVLQESEAFNRAILSSLGAHIAVLDPKGTIVAINEAWERFAHQNSAHCFGPDGRGNELFGSVPPGRGRIGRRSASGPGWD